MMKKLLVLMLVVGLTSVSQGALSWLQVDAGTPVPSVGTAGVIQVDLVADFPCIAFDLGVVSSTDTAGRVGSAVGSPYAGGYHPVMSTTQGYTFNADGYAINNAQLTPSVALLFDGAAAGPISVSAGAVIASFKYLIPASWSNQFTIGFVAEGTPYIDGFGDPYTAGPAYISDATDSYSIGSLTIIPEPATIALLGLGGLLLRRRKK
jgi:hypothetical protein